MRARKFRYGADDLAHIGELRKGAHRQERADLEMPHACMVFLAQPALFCRGRWKGFHHLQAVAQAYLAQGNPIIGIDVLNAGHASLAAVLPVAENRSASSSARTASVSAPSTGTTSPSPRLAPFHSTGRAGTRNASPLALMLLTRPPGRNTCGSSS